MNVSPVKEHLYEVLSQSKTGLIGSGILAITQAVYELSGERQVKTAMLYIGLTVGILTIVKLLCEIGPAWERFVESIQKRKERKQREHDQASH